MNLRSELRRLQLGAQEINAIGQVPSTVATTAVRAAMQESKLRVCASC